MNRPTAKESEAQAGEGTQEPDRVHPIANDAQDPEQVGFMYEGEQYGDDAWIICDTDDLIHDEF